jgi:hypothetical protein
MFSGYTVRVYLVTMAATSATDIISAWPMALSLIPMLSASTWPSLVSDRSQPVATPSEYIITDARSNAGAEWVTLATTPQLAALGRHGLWPRLQRSM